MDMPVNKTGADRFTPQIYLPFPFVLPNTCNISPLYGNICRFQFTGKYIYNRSILQHQLRLFCSGCSLDSLSQHLILIHVSLSSFCYFLTIFYVYFIFLIFSR